jgi:hypothetical protein
MVMALVESGIQSLRTVFGAGGRAGAETGAQTGLRGSAEAMRSYTKVSGDDFKPSTGDDIRLSPKAKSPAWLEVNTVSEKTVTPNETPKPVQKSEAKAEQKPEPQPDPKPEPPASSAGDDAKTQIPPSHEQPDEAPIKEGSGTAGPAEIEAWKAKTVELGSQKAIDAARAAKQKYMEQQAAKEIARQAAEKKAFEANAAKAGSQKVIDAARVAKQKYMDPKAAKETVRETPTKPTITLQQFMQEQAVAKEIARQAGKEAAKEAKIRNLKATGFPKREKTASITQPEAGSMQEDIFTLALLKSERDTYLNRYKRRIEESKEDGSEIMYLPGDLDNDGSIAKVETAVNQLMNENTQLVNLLHLGEQTKPRLGTRLIDIYNETMQRLQFKPNMTEQIRLDMEKEMSERTLPELFKTPGLSQRIVSAFQSGQLKLSDVDHLVSQRDVDQAINTFHLYPPSSARYEPGVLHQYAKIQPDIQGHVQASIRAKNTLESLRAAKANYRELKSLPNPTEAQMREIRQYERHSDATTALASQIKRAEVNDWNAKTANIEIREQGKQDEMLDQDKMLDNTYIKTISIEQSTVIPVKEKLLSGFSWTQSSHDETMVANSLKDPHLQADFRGLKQELAAANVLASKTEETALKQVKVIMDHINKSLPTTRAEAEAITGVATGKNLLGNFIQQEVGVCRHKALLTKYIGDRLGLDISLNDTHPFGNPRLAHTFNTIEINGKNYLLDAHENVFSPWTPELQRIYNVSIP